MHQCSIEPRYLYFFALIQYIFARHFFSIPSNHFCIVACKKNNESLACLLACVFLYIFRLCLLLTENNCIQWDDIFIERNMGKAIGYTILPVCVVFRNNSIFKQTRMKKLSKRLLICVCVDY